MCIGIGISQTLNEASSVEQTRRDMVRFYKIEQEPDKEHQYAQHKHPHKLHRNIKTHAMRDFLLACAAASASEPPTPLCAPKLLEPL